MEMHVPRLLYTYKAYMYNGVDITYIDKLNCSLKINSKSLLFFHHFFFRGKAIEVKSSSSLQKLFSIHV